MARPRGVEDWFNAVPELLTDSDWDVEVEEASSSLAHCTCPWGGRLIRVIVSDITVQDAPKNKSYVLLRPETRAKFEAGLEVLQHLAPGEATLKGWAAWGINRLWSIIFGEGSAGDAKSQLVTHQKFRRDYPSTGDATFASFTAGGDPREGFLMCSPNDETFDLVAVFSLPEEKFCNMAPIHFQLLLDSAQRASHWYLNRPGLPQLRQADEDAYLVLTIQSCKRGLPLYPVLDGRDATVTIAAGAHLGLDRWLRFSPSQVGSEKFRLAEYIRVFLLSLGHEVPIFGVLDGRRLVPYQCVVRREDWNRVRKLFLETFLLQKTAYRRANGGSTAPSINEDVDARFILEKSPEAMAKLRSDRSDAHRVVVRRTFVEVQSDEESERGVERRNNRRPKTTTILPVEIPVLAA